MIEYDEKVEELAKFCRANNQDDFLTYFTANWLCPLWENAWIDMERPGNRDGIHNTNNCCESFFKTLLGSFLGGVGNRKPADLLSIIEKNVFLYYGNIIMQMNLHCTKDNLKITKKSNFDILMKDDHVYFIVHKKYSCMVNTNTNQCTCVMYHCGGKCPHIPLILAHQKIQSPPTIPTIEPPKMKKKKKGPAKKQHLPSLLRAEKVKATIKQNEKNNPAPVARKNPSQDRNKPGPVPLVPSQRTRETIQRKRQLPIRFRKNVN